MMCLAAPVKQLVYDVSGLLFQQSEKILLDTQRYMQHTNATFEGLFTNTNLPLNISIIFLNYHYTSADATFKMF